MTNYIISKNAYESFIRQWKLKAASKTITASDMVMYNFIKCRPLDKGFSPIKNAQKIDSNGCDPMFAFNRAKNDCSYYWNLSKYDEAISPSRFIIGAAAQTADMQLRAAKQEERKVQRKKEFCIKYSIELTAELSELIRKF